MTKSNFIPIGPIRFLAFAILGLTFSVALAAPSVAFAAPQDDIFSRSDDKKAEKSTSETKSAKTESQSEASTSVVKESTAKIDQQTDGWFTIVDDDSMTEFRLPSKPIYKEISFSPIKGRSARVNHMHEALSSDKQISVTLSWWDLHQAPKGGAQIKAALDGAVQGAVINVFGEVTRMDPIRSGRVPGRDFDFKFIFNPPNGKSSEMSGKSRVFIQDDRRYQLTVISYAGKEDQELTDKFFDSLIIKSK